MIKNNDTQEIKQLIQRIDQALSRELIRYQKESQEIGANDLADAAIEFAMRGGKRLRGVLSVLGFRSFAPEEESAYLAAAGIELFHAYLLAHDDIMDEDTTRRGGPTLHVTFAKQHQDEKLGRALAILAGDLLSAWSQSFLQRAAQQKSSFAALAEFNRFHARVVLGQKLDVAPRRDAKQEDTAKAHDLKTGEYSFLMPLRVGALLAGATEEQAAPFTVYSLHLGRAFQAKDDLLGLFGDEKKLGKPIGTDIIAGRQNWLVTNALASGPQEELLWALTADAPPQDRISTAQRIIEASGAKARCERYIADEVEAAMQSLAQTNIPEEPRRLLSWVAQLVRDRES
jgi:geranylgeranyl diphosphate synthase type I